MMKLKKDNPVYCEILPIKQAGEKAASLTRQLLAFSRKQVHIPKILDLNDAITGLQKMVRRLIGEDINIEMIMKPGIVPIKADPGQIAQIVINLIVNARDAINERTGITSEKRITIETDQVVLDELYVSDHIGSHPGLHAVISVSDSGIGMDDELKGKIFEPFFTTKEKGKGTGLGLSTVYGIVKQNQGSIFVYSERGHGTTIKIHWPASEQETMKGDVHLEKHVPGGTETILFVEDDPGVRNFTSGGLLGLGYVVHEASNGEEAFQLLKDKNLQVDLLLSDIVMPRMGGKELYEKLKVENPAIRILLTSGYTDKHIVRGGELMEGLNFLQKPYSLQVLARKVREILDA
jgi:CheY-like chemotaxis protein